MGTRNSFQQKLQGVESGNAYDNLKRIKRAVIDEYESLPLKVRIDLLEDLCGLFEGLLDNAKEERLVLKRKEAAKFHATGR